jgi:hypothetical protein
MLQVWLLHARLYLWLNTPLFVFRDGRKKDLFCASIRTKLKTSKGPYASPSVDTWVSLVLAGNMSFDYRFVKLKVRCSSTVMHDATMQRYQLL